MQEHCALHLHANIVNSSHFPDMQQALMDGFLRTDADFLQQAISSQRNKDSLVGSAAVVMLATGQQLILAHAGDCRAVLVRREGAASSFEELTSDHSAEESAPCAGLLRPDEAERIKRVGQRGAQPPAAEVANGFVNVGDRTVPMTRAFGNMNLKVAQGRDLGCVVRPLARKAPALRLWSHSCARACVAGARACTSRSSPPCPR